MHAKSVLQAARQYKSEAKRPVPLFVLSFVASLICCACITCVLSTGARGGVRVREAGGAGFSAGGRYLGLRGERVHAGKAGAQRLAVS